MDWTSLIRVKDSALAKGVELWLRPKLERYGQLTAFRVDSAARTVNAELQLKGEPNLVVTVDGKFRVEEKDERTVLVLHSLKISREWAQNLVDDFFTEIPVDIPPGVAKLLGN